MLPGIALSGAAPVVGCFMASRTLDISFWAGSFVSLCWDAFSKACSAPGRSFIRVRTTPRLNQVRPSSRRLAARAKFFSAPGRSFFS